MANAGPLIVVVARTFYPETCPIVSISRKRSSCLMAELKTRKNDLSVDDYIAGMDEKRREDCRTVLTLMEEITGEKPAMWGSSIVGFGNYHYNYGSGREGDWFFCGFSSRKQNLTLYIMSGFSKYEALMEELGKHKTGVSCLYINKLSDVDMSTLRELIEQSVVHLKETYT